MLYKDMKIGTERSAGYFYNPEPTVLLISFPSDCGYIAIPNYLYFLKMHMLHAHTYWRLTSYKIPPSIYIQCSYSGVALLIVIFKNRVKSTKCISLLSRVKETFTGPRQRYYKDKLFSWLLLFTFKRFVSSSINSKSQYMLKLT